MANLFILQYVYDRRDFALIRNVRIGLASDQQPNALENEFEVGIGQFAG